MFVGRCVFYMQLLTINFFHTIIFDLVAIHGYNYRSLFLALVLACLTSPS